MDALWFCMLLPGPEAMQLATYAGWKRHGVAGGLVAGLWFVLPGALVVGTLACLYSLFGQLSALTAAFSGIRATVLVLVVEAMSRIAKRALTSRIAWWIATLSLLAVGMFGVPYPVLILAAALVGAMFLRRSAARTTDPTPQPSVPLGRTARTVAIWLAIWIVPLALLAALTGVDGTLARLAVFFSKLAVVTFGGAYAVLGYMAQDVVAHHHWLTAPEMLDGLGLAETTPGPLILVTEFVGFLAAHRAYPEAALRMGLMGGLVALWATFAPCFLWIFAGAPYLDRIRREPRLQGALSAITAAVLGVIVSLTLWFATHVLFRMQDSTVFAEHTLALPRLSSLDLAMLMLTLACGVLLMRFRWPVLRVLASAAIAAWALQRFVAPGR